MELCQIEYSDILFITPWYPLPRIIRRMKIAQMVSKVGVLYWEKNNDIEFPNKIPEEINRYIIKLPCKSGISLKRVLYTMAFYFKAMKCLKMIKPKCIHVTKMDLLFMVYIYLIIFGKGKKIKIIYEISDMHDLIYNDSVRIKNRIIKKILGSFEKVAGKVVSNVIVTSPLFWDTYYCNVMKNAKMLFIPNSSDEEVFSSYQHKEGGKFTIGYVGNLYFCKQIKELIDVAKELDINVILAGSSDKEDELRKYSKDNNNVYFYGKYNYERDIAKIYSKLDCVFAKYEILSLNVKIALPNRLYDATRCGLPLIVAKDTELENIVLKYDIGKSVDTMESLKNAIINLMKAPPNKYILNGDRFIKCVDVKKDNSELLNIYKESMIYR